MMKESRVVVVWIFLGICCFSACEAKSENEKKVKVNFIQVNSRRSNVIQHPNHRYELLDVKFLWEKRNAETILKIFFQNPSNDQEDDKTVHVSLVNFQDFFIAKIS